jgi:hypothetical protein
MFQQTPLIVGGVSLIQCTVSGTHDYIVVPQKVSFRLGNKNSIPYNEVL